MGRKKLFSESHVLDQAVDVFWKKGYELASLSQLLEATGLQKGSLYSTFKSKENLFSICLNRYAEHMGSQFESSGVEAKPYITQFFKNKLNHPKERKRKGCLLMNSSVELASLGVNQPDSEVDFLLQSIETNFKTAICSGIKEGSFSKKINPKKMAERLFALAFTVEELGKVGKSKAFLKNIINSTLKELDIQI